MISNGKIDLVKYDNRKLYSHDIKKYVNLRDVAELLEEDFDVVVHMHSTGVDVTNQALGEIIKKGFSKSEKIIELLKKKL